MSPWLPAPVGTAPSVGQAGRWVVAAVGAALLAEHAGAPAPDVGQPPEGVVPAIRRQRVTSLLAPHAVDLGLDGAAAQRLANLRFDDVTSGLAMVAHARAAAAALNRAGVDHLLVKGLALTVTVGRSAATRGGGDLDLWVRPAEVEAAQAALAEVGWRRRPDAAGLPAVGVGWRGRLIERIGNEVALVHPDRAPVDLHWRLCLEPGELGFGFDEAWAASVPLGGIGDGLRGLCPPHALAHVCYHARKEHFSILRQCVDVVDLAGACDPDEVSALAMTDPNVALALGIVAPLAPWLAGIAPPVRRLARLAAEVQCELGSTRWTNMAMRSTGGASRLATRWARESWLLRSSPRPAVALRHVAHGLVPVRLLTDEAPLQNRRRVAAR